MNVFRLLFFLLPGLAPIYCQTPFLKITYPARYDTFAVNRLRLAGAVNANAAVFINGAKARVYPHGAFVGRVDLHCGLNNIVVENASGAVVLTDTVKAFCEQLLTASPASPTMIDTTFVQPATDIWLYPGDRFQAICKGSPEAAAELKIGQVEPPYMLTPMARRTAGCYATFILPGVWPLGQPLQLFFSLLGQDGTKKEWKAPAKITLLDPQKPLLGLTRAGANLWNAPQEGVVFSVLPDSVPLQIIGKSGSRYHISLSKTMSGYIEEAEVYAPLQVMVLSPTPVSPPVINYEQDWLRLDMQVERSMPFVIEQSVTPATLELTLYGGYLSSAWIANPSANSEITGISWTQPEEHTLRWKIELNQKQQWGHRVVFHDQRLSLYIRRTPLRGHDTTRPLEGLIFAIDPGHGGSETGAISPVGLEEKNLNLEFGRHLAAAIRQAGGAVVFTRINDTLLTIQQRVDLARQARAHFYLWLHNNSVGPEVDATRVRGTSTYFLAPQNRVLALNIFDRLTRTGLGRYGCIQQSYTVTRLPDLLAVLIEGVFMSHPEDERLLMQPAFVKKMAAAVCNGVIDFVNQAR